MCLSNLPVYNPIFPKQICLEMRCKFPRKQHNIMLLKKISSDNSNKPVTKFKS